MESYFIFQNDQLLLSKNNNDLSLLSSSQIDLLKSSFTRYFSFTDLNQQSVHCAEIKNDASLPENIECIPLRKALEILGDDYFNKLSRAYSIIRWDKLHYYCGQCSKPTDSIPSLFERVCTSCAMTYYPRISPAIIVLIKKHDHVLMARAHHFMPGIYAMIAGFVEAGESLEQAVHREVMEEVGIKIKNLHYIGSQPWPFPDSLMMGFTADYDAGEITINENEIESAGWYRYDNLPGRPSSKLSIATKLIDDFILYWEKQNGSP